MILSLKIRQITRINNKNKEIKKSPVFNGGVAYGVYYSKSER
jgi:hypothetical protein